MVVAAFYLLIGLSQVMGLGFFGSAPSLAYERSEGDKTSTVRLTPNQDGTTTVTDLATGEERKLNLADYTSGATMKPIYQVRRDPDKFMVLTGLLTTLASALLVYIAFAKDYKRYRLRRVVAVAARET